MNKVFIFLAEGFEEIEGLTVVDLLRRAKIDVKMISISNTLEVTGGHGIQVTADEIFEKQDFSDAEMMVLPGGMPGTLNLGGHDRLKELLEMSYEDGKQIAAICAAPSVLGDMGILKGKKATCYPGFEERLTGAHTTLNEVEKDGNIMTSRGLGTAIPFALALIEHFQGKTEAEKIGNSIIYRA